MEGRFVILVLIASSILHGCATTTFSPEGRAVRTISPAIAQECEHLGLPSSWKPALEGGASAAQADIRNKVAELGGNAMVVVSQQIDPPPYQHARIMAEAYRATSRNPSNKDWPRLSTYPFHPGVSMISTVTCPNCGEKLDVPHQEVEQLRKENDRLLDENAALRKHHSGHVAAGGYVASKLRAHFHRPECYWAQYVLSSPNLVHYDAHDEAVADGKKPCKTCQA